jgi:hypothetical protein
MGINKVVMTQYLSLAVKQKSLDPPASLLSQYNMTNLQILSSYKQCDAILH